MKSYLIGLALLGSVAPAQSTPPPSVSKHVEKILSRGDGATQATAYKVSTVHDEYEILAALHLTPKEQALVVGKKPYDAITAVDPATGAERKLWFDISSFYPEF
jgi:hypothetical protein